jgi:hypothetical protein
MRLARLGKASLSLLTMAACATGSGTGKIDPSLEMPKHTVLFADGRHEVRRIAPLIVAETVVEGDYDEATRSAFRILAGYIFGGNRAKQKIAMTAPVASAVDDESETIAMTAPVESVPAPADGDQTPRWKTSFMMPSAYTLDTLPEPNDARVRFVERPSRCVAVSIFDGFTTDTAVRERTDALRAWLDARGLASDGETTVARYNDPLTLPWNRRNEVWVALDDESCARSEVSESVGGGTRPDARRLGGAR